MFENIDEPEVINPVTETEWGHGGRHPTALDEACYSNEAAEKELEQLRASAARWDAIETLMFLGDVELTQADDGGYSIFVEPVENIMARSWEGDTPEHVADKVVATRITAGEDEAEVMTDFGYERRETT